MRFFFSAPFFCRKHKSNQRLKVFYKQMNESIHLKFYPIKILSTKTNITTQSNRNQKDTPKRRKSSQVCGMNPPPDPHRFCHPCWNRHDPNTRRASPCPESIMESAWCRIENLRRAQFLNRVFIFQTDSKAFPSVGFIVEVFHSLCPIETLPQFLSRILTSQADPKGTPTGVNCLKVPPSELEIPPHRQDAPILHL